MAVGIKETVDVLALVKILGEKFEQVAADGKVTVAEVLAELVGSVGPLMAAIDGVANVPEELKDLTAEEVGVLAGAAFMALQPYLRLLKK